MRSAIEAIFRPWRLLNSSRSGSRAMLPSSFMISHSTAAGWSPASCARSQHASVCPARASTPPACAIRRRNPGGDARGGLDRYSEIRAVHRAVARHHRQEIEALGVRLGDRHADQAAAELRHEVDLLGSDEFGRENQVALVLAILVVD